MNRIARLIRLRFGLPFVRRADRARSAAEWIDAVIDYRRGLDWMPWREDLKVQIGNCLKEFGDYGGAMRAYASVTTGLSVPEARKQAADANRRAGGHLLAFEVAESPDGIERPAAHDLAPAPSPRLLPDRILLDAPEPRGWLGALGREAHLPSRLRGAGYAAIKLDQVGVMMVQRHGAPEPLFAGIVAVRGRVTTLASLDAAELRVGEGDAAAVIAEPLRLVPGSGPLRTYVFNAWLDARALPAGRHWLAVGAGRQVAPAGLYVNIVHDVDATAFASSNAFAPSPDHGVDPSEAIVSAPALVRPARRSLFDAPVRSVLALRVDQLGDVAASLPALVRLRAIFPDARLTVVAQPGVQAVIAASGVADEVLPLTLGYDIVSEQRRLDPAEEARARAMLAERAFDLAIDLSPGDESRPLLLMTGATYLVGFNPDRFGYLDFGVTTRSRDKVNRLERLPHAAAIAMLVESLAIAAAPARPPVPRTAAPEVLASLGLRAQRYVVLHLGARHAINRWPAAHYAELCDRVLAETAYDVVLFGLEGDSPRERVHRFDMLDADTFDIVVSGAKALVGNDSGPKHLAATRGVPTVSVHVDRLNWNEWGQDGVGAIVSKRVPCTGCGLNDIALCGREAVCVRSITVDEVWGALRSYL